VAGADPLLTKLGDGDVHDSVSCQLSAVSGQRGMKADS
jgi:hypothetical protein